MMAIMHNVLGSAKVDCFNFHLRVGHVGREVYSLLQGVL